MYKHLKVMLRSSKSDSCWGLPIQKAALEHNTKTKADVQEAVVCIQHLKQETRKLWTEMQCFVIPHIVIKKQHFFSHHSYF